MESLANWLGIFLGKILAQLAPVIVNILSESIKRAITPTVEEAKLDVDLRSRLVAAIERMRNKNNSGAGRNASAN